MRTAAIDPRLSARIVSVRPLVYTTAASPDDDRPPHVRAASGIAAIGDRLVVVQDDASFIAIVEPALGYTVTAIAMPFGPNRRRRFEVALGNKLDKIDLEACVAVDDEVWAFGSGSGSLPVREKVVRVVREQGDEAVVVDAAPFYQSLRVAIGALNLEGVAVMGDELWLCHRGNTGPDDPGPAIARVHTVAMRAFLDGGAPPALLAIDRYDLGSIRSPDQPGHSRLGFTDACARDNRMFYVAAAEASVDAIDDGAILGSQLGVVDGDTVRAAPLVGLDGRPVKVEGLTFIANGTWVTLDPDDPAQATPLCEVVLGGPW